MRRFVYLFQVYREYVFLAVLVAVSIALFPLNNNPQIKQLRAYSIAGIGLLNEPVTYITESFTLRAENQRLRHTNIRLADEVYQLREARIENIRLRRMLQFLERSSYELVPAKVVGQSVDPLRNTITVNVGTQHGIHEQMPILDETGLVGRVILAGERYAVGQILFNRDFRTSGKVERSRVDGIVQWDGSAGMLLNNVAKTLDVIEGDVVVTSEYSNVFPPGIFIGVVSHVSNIPGGVTKEIHIRPGVDFSKLEEVFVVLYRPDEDKVALEQHVNQR